jgi:outer membrane receptor for ferrienterochelin and colicins
MKLLLHLFFLSSLSTAWTQYSVRGIVTTNEKPLVGATVYHAASQKGVLTNAQDPFDTQVEFDSEGAPKPTLENPHALTFDPSYVFASNQGRRLFLGMRWNLK